MRHNKFIYGMMAAATLLAASCTDFDDYNQAYQTGSAESNVTLWGNISSRSDLSEFASLLVKGGFDKELDKSRFYTVWAPKNGTFDFATYNQMDSATLVDRFIKSNVADFNYVLSSSFNERVHALNEKSYTFQNENGSTYDENKVVTANIPNVNGTLHITEGAAVYRPNIYEFIFDHAEEGVDTSLAVYLKKYETAYLDLENSIPGPIDTLGRQTYSDSVIIVENDMINQMRALIDEEDSLYTMFVPTEEAYETTYKKISSHYRYADVTKYYPVLNDGPAKSATTIDDYDSDYLTDSLARWYLAKDLVVSHHNGYNYWLDEVDGPQPAVFDTLLTTTFDKLSHAEDFIARTVGEPQRMSNGYVRMVDSLAFLPWEVWCPEIYVNFINDPSTYMPYFKDCVGNTMEVPYNMFNSALGDYIPYYVDFVPSGDRSQPEVYFMLPNVRSAKYNVYVVFVPSNVMSSAAESGDKPLQFEAEISYVSDEDGGTDEFDFDGTEFVLDGERLNRIDTFLLGEMEFPYAYAYVDEEGACMPYLHLSVKRSSKSDREKYTNEMRIAGVILRPVEYDQFLIKEDESL